MDKLSSKIKLINNSSVDDITQSMNTLKVKINKMESYIESASLNKNAIKDSCNNEVKIHDDFKPFQLILGKKVKHKEEDIIGEIKFIGNQKIAIVWEDNTRERMTINEARSSLEYVDDIQSLVAPTSSQMSYNPTVNRMLDKAIAALDEEENDIVEVGNIEGVITSDVIDIEKIKMQRKIEELNNKLTDKNTNFMKEKIANEIITLAVSKGIIDNDDSDIEMQKVLSFNDDEFEKYKNSVLEYEDDGSIVTSTSAPVPVNLTEAEIMLQKIKGNGGNGIIGDFSNELKVHTSEANNSTSGLEKRSLAELRDEKFTFSKVDQKIPTFEDQFESILSNSLQNMNHTNSVPVVKENKELPGFENIQGLKKPIRVTEKSSAYPSNTTLSELFSNMNWTTISKVH